VAWKQVPNRVQLVTKRELALDRSGASWLPRFEDETLEQSWLAVRERSLQEVMPWGWVALLLVVMQVTAVACGFLALSDPVVEVSAGTVARVPRPWGAWTHLGFALVTGALPVAVFGVLLCRVGRGFVADGVAAYAGDVEYLGADTTAAAGASGWAGAPAAGRRPGAGTATPAPIRRASSVAVRAARDVAVAPLPAPRRVGRSGSAPGRQSLQEAMEAAAARDAAGGSAAAPPAPGACCEAACGKPSRGCLVLCRVAWPLPCRTACLGSHAGGGAMIRAIVEHAADVHARAEAAVTLQGGSKEDVATAVATELHLPTYAAALRLASVVCVVRASARRALPLPPSPMPAPPASLIARPVDRPAHPVPPSPPQPTTTTRRASP